MAFNKKKLLVNLETLYVSFKRFRLEIATYNWQVILKDFTKL